MTRRRTASATSLSKRAGDLLGGCCDANTIDHVCNNYMKHVFMNCLANRPKTSQIIATIFGLAVTLLSCGTEDPTAPPNVTFEISGDSTLILGDSLRLTVKVQMSGAGQYSIVWTTSDPTILTVLDGSVRAVGVGTATIVARLTSPELASDVTREKSISASYASIAIDPVDSLTSFGESRQLVVRGYDVAGNPHSTVGATFSALDPSIVSTTPTGVVTARGNGTGRVTAAHAGLSHEMPIRVRQVTATIIFPSPQLTLPALHTDTQIIVEVRDASDSIIVTPAITWESSDPSIVTVSPGGVVRALQVSSAVISAHVDTVTASLPITVSQVVANLSAKDAATQSGMAGMPVATLPTVVVRDAGGSPIEGRTVTFATASGNGQLTDSVQVTDSAGEATLGGWTLGTTAGPHAVTASVEDMVTTFTVDVRAGPADAEQSLVTVESSAVTAGETTTATLVTRDQYGNTLATGGATVAFGLSGGSSSGTFSNLQDHANGTYSVTFTGAQAGTPTTVTAVLDGAPVTSTLPTVTVTPGAVAQIAVDAGDGQTANAGTPVATPPSVIVRDAFDNPIPGTDVVFTVLSGGGSVIGSPALTNASGIATLSQWILGPVAGAYSIQASADGLNVVFNGTGSAGPVSGSGSTVIASAASLSAGDEITLTLEAKDAFGNAIGTGGASVTFGLSGGTSGGTLSVVTDNGDGTYTTSFTGITAGSPSTVEATIAGEPVTTTLPTITVNPGPATQLSVVAGDNQTQVVGTTLMIAPSVLVQDAFGNSVPNIAVTFNVTLGDGTTTGSAQTTDATGIATIGSWTLGTVSGLNQLTVAAETLNTTIGATATVGPVSLATSIVSIGSGSVTAGSNTTITLVARDQYGNQLPAGGLSVSFALAGGTSSGTIGIIEDNSDGTYAASFTGITAGSPSTVGATIDGQSVTTTLPTITVNPGPATQLSVVAGDDQTQEVGTTLTTAPVVLVRDAFDNPVPEVGVTFSVAQGGGGITEPTPTTGADGTATLGSWTLGTVPGLNQLDVTAGALNATLNATATVGPVSMDMSTVSVESSNVTAGNNTVLTLVARDQYSNQLPTGGLSVSFVLSGGTSGGTIGATSDNDDGTYTATFTGMTAGTATNVGATVDGTVVTSIPPTITVSPGPPTEMTIVAGDGQSALALSTVAVRPAVLLRDAFNNLVPGSTVTFTVTQGGGSVTGEVQVTGVDGTATVGDWTVGVQPGANALQASTPGLEVVFTATAIPYWFANLPAGVRDDILWIGDAEEGTLDDWTMSEFQDAGGGIFNTGGDDVTADTTTAVLHSGVYSAEATITNAIQAQNGPRAVRLMRWTNTAWDNGGEYFPTEAYFSTWMYIPTNYNPNKYAPWDPGDGGWWNVFEFKSEDENAVSQPIWVLNVGHDDVSDEMFFYLFSGYNIPEAHQQPTAQPIPVGQWVHVEAYYAQSSTNLGRITVWQDGVQIFDVQDVVTILAQPAVWGIGNYTDHIAGGAAEGTATIYFDDAAVSTVPLYPYR